MFPLIMFTSSYVAAEYCKHSGGSIFAKNRLNKIFEPNAISLIFKTNRFPYLIAYSIHFFRNIAKSGGKKLYIRISKRSSVLFDNRLAKALLRARRVPSLSMRNMASSVALNNVWYGSFYYLNGFHLLFFRNATSLLSFRHIEDNPR